jgi:hypothetical protein
LKALIILLSFYLFAISVNAQEISWKRQKEEVKAPLTLFHSVQAVNLPTAEMLSRNEFQYEISHRFIKTVDANKAYFGIDGPAYIRMALGYAITDHLTMTLGRSNKEDNYDFRAKYQVLRHHSQTLPLLGALRIGAAWNTEVYEPVTNKLRDIMDSKNFQFYAQAILNTMFAKKLGVGIVPSYLYNSHIYCEDTEYSFTLGGYIQYYLLDMFSVYAEYNPTVTGWRKGHNPIAIGIEIETGGHFFKIFLGNSYSLNPSQYLTGADLDIEKGDWRLGFNITRILVFKHN